MAKVDSLVQDFLNQKKIAVVGVSDKRDTGCNEAYKRFQGVGLYRVCGQSSHNTFTTEIPATRT